MAPRARGRSQTRSRSGRGDESDAEQEHAVPLKNDMAAKSMNQMEMVKEATERIMERMAKGDVEGAKRAQQELTAAMSGSTATTGTPSAGSTTGAASAEAPMSGVEEAKNTEEKLRRLAGGTLPAVPPAPKLVHAALATPVESQTMEDKLRLAVAMHDDQIRTLKAAAMSCYCIEADSELAKIILQSGKEYAQVTKGKSPVQHGLGAPGPLRFAAVAEWAAGLGPSAGALSSAFSAYVREYWQGATLLEKGRAIRVFQVGKMYDRKKLRLEVATGPEAAHTRALNLITMAVAHVGGSELQGAAPRGALIREIAK